MRGDVITKAMRAAKRIGADIEDRSGLGNEFEQVDAATRRQIYRQWAALIYEEFCEEKKT